VPLASPLRRAARSRAQWLTAAHPPSTHDLAGLREHFNPRARWGSAIAAVRAAQRLRRPSSAALSTTSSGGWANSPGSASASPSGTDSESDGDDAPATATAREKLAGAPPPVRHSLSGGPPGENANVTVTAPASPQEAPGAGEVGAARDFAAENAAPAPEPAPPVQEQAPEQAPAPASADAPPAPTEGHQLRREDSAHPAAPNQLSGEDAPSPASGVSPAPSAAAPAAAAHPPTPLVDTHARDQANKAEQQEYLDMPGSFHVAADGGVVAVPDGDAKASAAGENEEQGHVFHRLMAKMNLR
jgi:calcium/calmodulin-dependent protein kinase I